jgi:ribonuclease J
VYSEITDEFHVSGHGSEEDLKLLISLAKPKYLIPIGGTYRQMVAYKHIAKEMRYREDDVKLLENGQTVVFSNGNATYGEKIDVSSIYLDEITGKEIDSYVIFDRMKISKEGIVVVIVEVDSQNGQIITKPDVFTKGFVYENKDRFIQRLEKNLQKTFGRKKERVGNWGYYRKVIEDETEKILASEGREPLIIPIVLEV